MNIKNKRIIAANYRKKERKKLYLNLDIKNIANNKLFWETMKAFCIDKYTLNSKISLERKDRKNITDDQELANTFNGVFENAAND